MKKFLKLMAKLSTPTAEFVASECDAPTISFHLLYTLTNKEKNAARRSKLDVPKSTLTKSIKTSSQAYRIDEALKSFHTFAELIALPQLDDCSTARIKSHISHIERLFRNTLKKEVVGDSFRFVAI